MNKYIRKVFTIKTLCLRDLLLNYNKRHLAYFWNDQRLFFFFFFFSVFFFGEVEFLKICILCHLCLNKPYIFLSKANICFYSANKIFELSTDTENTDIFYWINRSIFGIDLRPYLKSDIFLYRTFLKCSNTFIKYFYCFLFKVTLKEMLS